MSGNTQDSSHVTDVEQCNQLSTCTLHSSATRRIVVSKWLKFQVMDWILHSKCVYLVNIVLVVPDETLDLLNEQHAGSRTAAAAAPAIPILMSSLLYTQSSGQLVRGWIIYIRCQGQTLAHITYIILTRCSDFYMTVCFTGKLASALTALQWHEICSLLLLLFGTKHQEGEFIIFNTIKKSDPTAITCRTVKMGIHYHSESEGL